MRIEPEQVSRLVKEKLLGMDGAAGSKGFTSAYLRLTLWYLLIIMALSLVFSVAVYFFVSSEIDRTVRTKQDVTQEQSFAQRLLSEKLDEETANEAKVHLAFILLALNGGVLLVAGLLSFRIAVREIKPIQEALELQSQFTADASHELRTPLTAMKTEIEVALRGGGPGAEEARGLLESNLEEIDKLDALSNSLLKLSRYEYGVDMGARDTCPLAEIVAESVSRVRSAADARGISIRTDVDPVAVSGARGSLVELIVILLDNAIKYSGDSRTVTISSHRQRHHVVFEVRDQGIGIDAMDLPHVFERFYRVEHSRSKDLTEGFGLGLAIAQKIVSAHGGSIDLDSAPGQGTTVTVKLPIAR